MAVRVISQPPPQKPHRIKCKKCVAMLEFLSSDVHQRGDQREWFTFIKCPHCRQEAEVPDRYLP